MTNTPINIPSFEEAARIEQFVNFSKNSYLVNNNALYNKHTEHISTTEPIFIDGMAGSDNVVHERGGDASQNTYWAYEYESGKFLLGKFNEDDIKVECETDSSNLWIVDAEGVYIEQDALDSYMESDCLEAINAKYGTSFTALTMQKVTSIAIGDNVLSWDAYEKIYAPVPETLLFKKAAGQQFIIAKYSNKSLEIACGVGSTTLIVVDNQGVVVTLQGPPFDSMKDSFEGSVEYAGHEVETTSIWEVSINVGDTMENWDNYITI